MLRSPTKFCCSIIFSYRERLKDQQNIFNLYYNIIIDTFVPPEVFRLQSLILILLNSISFQQSFFIQQLSVYSLYKYNRIINYIVTHCQASKYFLKTAFENNLLKVGRRMIYVEVTTKLLTLAHL